MDTEVNTAPAGLAHAFRGRWFWIALLVSVALAAAVCGHVAGRGRTLSIASLVEHESRVREESRSRVNTPRQAPHTIRL